MKVIPFMEDTRNEKLEVKKECQCQKRRQEKAMKGNKEETTREKGKREWIGRQIQSHGGRNKL